SCLVILGAELVPQPRGFFVVFPGDRLAEAGAEPQAMAAAGASAGGLAHVPGRAVIPLDQRDQPGGEDLVVLRAAEPAAGAELHELDAAIGAGQLGQLAD